MGENLLLGSGMGAKRAEARVRVLDGGSSGPWLVEEEAYSSPGKYWRGDRVSLKSSASAVQGSSA